MQVDNVKDRTGGAFQNRLFQLLHRAVVQQVADALRRDGHIGIITRQRIVIALRIDKGQAFDQILAVHEGSGFKMTSAPETGVKIGQDLEHQKIIIIFGHGSLLTSWLKPCILPGTVLGTWCIKNERYPEQHADNRGDCQSEFHPMERPLFRTLQA